MGIGVFCAVKNNQKMNGCFMLDLDEIREICQLHICELFANMYTKLNLYLLRKNVSFSIL